MLSIGTELSLPDPSHGRFVPRVLLPPQTIPGDCGTFIVTGGNLYAPDFSGHGVTRDRQSPTYTPFTPVSQSGVTGTGTAGDPYRVVTNVDVGTTGLHIQQTDSYVVGDESTGPTSRSRTAGPPPA